MTFADRSQEQAFEHSSPAIAERCPVCHPERKQRREAEAASAAVATQLTEQLESQRIQLDYQRGMIDEFRRAGWFGGRLK